MLLVVWFVFVISSLGRRGGHSKGTGGESDFILVLCSLTLGIHASRVSGFQSALHNVKESQKK